MENIIGVGGFVLALLTTGYIHTLHDTFDPLTREFTNVLVAGRTTLCIEDSRKIQTVEILRLSVPRYSMADIHYGTP